VSESEIKWKGRELGQVIYPLACYGIQHRGMTNQSLAVAVPTEAASGHTPVNASVADEGDFVQQAESRQTAGRAIFTAFFRGNNSFYGSLS